MANLGFCDIILLKNREVRSKMNEEIKNEAMNTQEEVVETFELEGVTEKPKKAKSKEKIILLTLLVLLVLIGGLVGYGAYKHLTENPTNIIKKVINRTYEDFSSSLKVVKKEKDGLNFLKDPVKISGELKYNDKNFEGLDRESITFDVGLDYSKSLARGLFGLKKDSKTIGDVEGYFKNDKLYLRSNTLFDNTYDLGESKFNEMFDFSYLEKNTSETFTTEDIDYIVRGFKNALLDSLDADKMTISDVDLVIDGESIKTKKISYKIDSESYSNLTKSLAGNILKDEKLIEKIALVSGKEKSEIKQALESIEKSNTNNNINGEFSIYTTGVDYKVVKVEILDSKDTCSIIAYKDKTNFKFDISGTMFEIDIEKNGEVYDTDIYVNGDRCATLNFRQLDDEGVDFDYKVMTSSIDLNGTVKFTLKDEGNKKYSGETIVKVKGEIMGEKVDIDVNLSYNIEAGSALPSIDEHNAIEDWTAEDMYKMRSGMLEIENSALYQYFGGSPLISDEEYDY